jgi:uncharacterized protein YlxW (UPF0749 family)
MKATSLGLLLASLVGGKALTVPKCRTRVASPKCCIGAEEAKTLSQELRVARLEASDAKNAEARLRNMVSTANQNAEALSREAERLENELEDLRAKLESNEKWKLPLAAGMSEKEVHCLLTAWAGAWPTEASRLRALDALEAHIQSLRAP